MATPLKHVGKNTTNGARCAVVFRQITDAAGNVVEADHALVVYPDTLPLTEHQYIMRIIESEPAQRTGNLYEAMNRETVTNGANALQWLHGNGYLKKVTTAEIILVPAAGHEFPLNEINRIVELQASGLSEQQINNMMQDDTNKAPRQHSTIDAGAIPSQVAEPAMPAPEVLAEAAQPVVEAPAETVVAPVALDPTAQAEAMLEQAKEMIRQAEELKAAAIDLDPSVKPGRGRPKAKA
jgi:hypothetical protein